MRTGAAKAGPASTTSTRQATRRGSMRPSLTLAGACEQGVFRTGTVRRCRGPALGCRRGPHGPPAETAEDRPLARCRARARRAGARRLRVASATSPHHSAGASRPGRGSGTHSVANRAPARGHRAARAARYPARDARGAGAAAARRERHAGAGARERAVVPPGALRLAVHGRADPALRGRGRQHRQRREPAAAPAVPRSRSEVSRRPPQGWPVRRPEELPAARPGRRRAGLARRAAHGRGLPATPAPMRGRLSRARQATGPFRRHARQGDPHAARRSRRRGRHRADAQGDHLRVRRSGAGGTEPCSEVSPAHGAEERARDPGRAARSRDRARHGLNAAPCGAQTSRTNPGRWPSEAANGPRRPDLAAGCEALVGERPAETPRTPSRSLGVPPPVLSREILVVRDERHAVQAPPMRPTRPTSLVHAFAAVVPLLLAFPNAARAIHHNVTVLGDTQCTNDTAIQLLRVREDSADAFSWNNCVKLTFQNAAGALTGEFAVLQDVPAGNGFIVGIGTAELASTPGAPPIHLVIPSNLMTPGGTVCYRGIKGNTHIPDGRGCSAIDLCVPVTQATCGCDRLPNSGKTLDRCGVCGGNGSTCGCGNGIVDPGEQCDGGPCCSATCTFLPATTVCRPAAGDCDVAETCTGASAACPADTSKAAGTPCADDGNPCTLDLCDGARTTCQHPAGNAGAVCRPAASLCDLAEDCDGASAACPPDGFAPSSFQCRAAAGVCDGAEFCPGNGPTCTADSVRPAGTACPDDGNACTLDQCDGTGVTRQHPPASAGTVCRPAAAPRDVAEVCAGTGRQCPGDSFLSAATECRPAAGACDVAEFCSGNGPTCPLDAKLPNGSLCSDGSLCTTGDTCKAGVCSGTPVACPASDQCHLAGTCDPATGTCSSPVAANGTACNDGNACTAGDTCQAGTCTGTAVTCPASDQCHLAGTCDPATGSCSNPVAANGTICNDGNACTTGDTCQAGMCAGTPVLCTARDQCHGVGTCNPVTGTCSNPPAPNGTSCSDGNACTTGDSCQAGF